MGSEHANGKRAANGGAVSTAGIQSLPESALINIWQHIPTSRNKVENRHALPLVCRRWWRIMRSAAAVSALWTDLDVTLPAYSSLKKFPLEGLYRWIMLYGSRVNNLILEINCRECWLPANALLGLLGPRLTSLRIYSDNDDTQAFEPKSNAPWLALLPRLQSLELEGVVDITVERGRFPRQLTHVALNGCGQTGLHRVPEVLTRLTNLRSLSLQFLDPGADLEGLAALTNLERLDLSNCSLREVPAELRELTKLTSLTLNNNEDLGGKVNDDRVSTLADLKSLAVLEMRDCALKSVPYAVTGLRSLRTLLLGYNDLTNDVIIPPGPYLSSLELLAMSDSIPEPVSVLDMLVKPLAKATSLQVLRINRNWGLTLSTAVTAALLKGKPHFKKLEYSEDMGIDLDVAKLRKVFPGVTFKVVE